MAKTKSQIAADGKARADAFMAKFADYSTTPTYRRRRKALDERQARTLAKDLSGERRASAQVSSGDRQERQEREGVLHPQGQLHNQGQCSGGARTLRVCRESAI